MSEANDSDPDSNEHFQSGPNPYQPPHTTSAIQHDRRKNSWLAWASGLQVLTILVALVAEHIEHQTIVGSGPVLFLIGLAVALIAFRRRHVPGIVVGGSAIVLCAFVVFLINFNGWSPANGDRPITLIGYAYTGLVVPLAIHVIWSSRSEGEAGA